MVISFSTSGSFDRTLKFLKFLISGQMYKLLQANAQRGIDALASATPVDSGLTAASWTCDVKVGLTSATITWNNTNIHNGFPVAIMLQYGHGTGTGGYVQGEDYINPAIRPIFDEIANTVWRAVTSA